jgi:ABC-2 type transport system ATP-binding protein
MSGAAPGAQPLSSLGLAVENICVRRAQRVILDRVSLAIERGEIIAVIGANGAGKTTLLEAVVGATRAHSGKVLFGGRELASLATRSLVFSYMPDAAEPPAEVRVSALMHLAQRFGLTPDERARHLEKRLGLESLASARAGELSRGEKRRVSLFAALCTNRPIIVLDEPLGAFDPLQLLDVLDVMRECARNGSALLLSVHQLSDAEKIASRVLILDQGRTVAIGTLAELRTRVERPEASLEEIFLRLLETQRARS